MKPVILLIVFAAGIAGCIMNYPPPTAAEIRAQREAEMEAKLPKGCKVTDLGSFGEIDRIVAVQCEGKAVVNTIDVTRRTRLVGKVMTTETDSNSVINIMPEGGER